MKIKAGDARAALSIFAPRLHFHKRERFPATPVTTLTDATLLGSRTQLLRADGTPIASTSNGDGLPPLSLSVLAATEATYPRTSVEVRIDDYLRGERFGEAEHRDPPTAYGRVKPLPDGNVWLQYWLFYYDNPHHLVGNHQGDWELLQLKVNPARAPEDGSLLAATYFQHGLPESREGRDLSQLVGEDGLLDAFIALGSHASYFDDRNIRFGDDIAPTSPSIRPEVLLVDEEDPWMLWPGYWGGTRVMGFPRSPRGPRMCRAEWNDPEERYDAGLSRSREPEIDRSLLVPRKPRRHEAPEIALLARRPTEAFVEDLEQEVRGLHLDASVSPVLPDSDDTLLVTTNLASAEVEANITSSAFELARSVSARSGWEIEPDLDSTIFRPSPDSYGVCETLRQGEKEVRWAIEAIGCPAAWRTSDGNGIRVGHPDTGYVDHAELNEVIGTGGYDVYDDDADPRDVLGGIPPVQFPGHGTGTASVIASRRARDSDLVGAAPGASVVPFRIARTVVLFRGSRLVRAIALARRAHCQVLSISMGGLFLGSALRRELEDATRNGLIVIAAAGQPTRFVVEPASYGSTVAVAGSTFDDRPWRWSARGEDVAICAPAARVFRAAAPGGIAHGDGTSFSAALSAGVAAMWLARHGETIKAKDPEAVQPTFLSMVQASARRPADWDVGFGAGIIDADALMAMSPDEIRPEAQPAPRSRADRILRWLSRLVEADVEPWLRSMSARVENAAERYGTELAYLASEDEGARLEMKAEAARAARDSDRESSAVRELGLTAESHRLLAADEPWKAVRTRTSRLRTLASSSLRGALGS